jgi:CHAT domain-containing protein
MKATTALMLSGIRRLVRRTSSGLVGPRDIDAELGWSPVREVPEELKDLFLAAQDALAQCVDGRDETPTKALSEAWERIIDHARFDLAPSTFRADIFNRSVIALQWRAAERGTTEGLATAVARSRHAMRLVAPHDGKLAAFCSNLASAQLTLYHLGGDATDLDAAIVTAEEAREVAASGSFAASATRTLASALDTRFRKLGNPADIARAIELGEEAVRIGEVHNTHDLDASRELLSDILARRFEAFGSIDDVHRAIGLREAKGPGSDAGFPGARDGGLGRLLRLRWTMLHDATDIDRAVELLRRSVEASHTSNPVRSTNLGNALVDRYAVRGELPDLLAAVQAHESAVNATELADWQMASRRNNAGNSRLALFEHRSDVAERRRAIEHYRRAIELTGADEPELASRLYNLGRALSSPGPGGDEAGAREAYRQACSAGLSAGLQWALASSRAWAQLAAGRQDWDEAAQALRLGLEAVDRLFRRQLGRDEKENWLSRARGVAADAAVALTMIGESAEAAVALERGRAYMLSEVLERDRADLRDLQTADRQDLATRYRDASDVLRRARGADATRGARADLDSAITAIRAVPGFMDFLQPPEYSDLGSVATESCPLVYVVGAGAGGVALIVSRGTTPRVVRLPELTDDSIARRAEALWLAHLGREGRPSAWRGTLDAVTAWLWRAIMAHLLTALEPIRQAVLVPVGVLGVLPLHAAWTPDPMTKTGRRYALDTIALSYVPNARSLAASQHNARGRQADRFLAVHDPAPSRLGDVPAAELEVASIRGRFPHAVVRSGASANRANVLSLLPTFDVVHFACHGIAFPEAPLESGLLLVADELLTLRELLDMGLANEASGGRRLAVLSACEASRLGESLPDEVVSLPSGMLQAGFAGVVAPQWAVDGPASAMLMARFYELLGREGQTPPTSLRDAQCWLRDTTNAEKAAWFAGEADAASDPGAAEALRVMWRATARKPPNLQAHANPQYWAGFAHCGV